MLRSSFSLSADVRRTSDEYRVLLAAFLRDADLSRLQVTGAIIASGVPPLTDIFGQLCKALFGRRPLVIGSGTKTGIRIATNNPREVGSDRVVNAVAAVHLVGSPCIVVDLDTATTFDAVAGDGSYAGCSIAPGLAISAEALFQRAALLQRVELAAPRFAIGKDTASALQSGLIFGHVALVEGMIQRLRSELDMDGSGTVVATGDLAPLLAAHTRTIDRLEPRLSLIGLRLLYERNNGDS